MPHLPPLLLRPGLCAQVFRLLVAKVTLRQAARTLGCGRGTVEHRLRLLGAHCREFHHEQLRRVAAAGGLRGVFQLDELETFEGDRRLAPVTVPVLIESKSFFVLHANTAPLPARGNLSASDRKRKAAREAREGVRKSGSAEAVQRCWERLAAGAAPGEMVEVATDCKSQTAGSWKRHSGRGCCTTARTPASRACRGRCSSRSTVTC